MDTRSKILTLGAARRLPQGAVTLASGYFDGFRAALPAERASGDLEQVVIASADGRVDSLLVAVGVQKWGRFDMANRRVELHDDAAPGDEDLIDLAAILTLERSGSVFAVAPDYMPDHLPVAAVFRY